MKIKLYSPAHVVNEVSTVVSYSQCTAVVDPLPLPCDVTHTTCIGHHSKLLVIIKQTALLNTK